MRIEHCGDRAFLIHLGTSPHPALSRRIALLRQRLIEASPAGLDDAIVGFVTLLVHYDPDITSADTLAAIAQSLVPGESEPLAGRTWIIPVCYHESVAPDLEHVARATGAARDDIVQLHASHCYTVYLIGFSPGFPYLGDLDARLALPRRPDPRARVPAGSVAIATRYTAIYPQDTPGGWHLIGRTPLRLFDAAAAAPALLSIGDQVRFRRITLDDYGRLCEQVAADAYSPECIESCT